MSKGIGRVEKNCLAALEMNAREGSLTLTGQQSRPVKAASYQTILQAIYYPPISRAKRVSVQRALMTLAKAGRIGLFYVTENGWRRLYVEQISTTLIKKKNPLR